MNTVHSRYVKISLKKWYKNAIVILITFCIGSQFAKAGVIIWDKVYGGTEMEYLYSAAKIVSVSDGFIAVGSSISGLGGNKTSENYGIEDFWIVKCADNGAIQWQRDFGGNDCDRCTSILPTIDGGYLAGGYSKSNISGNKLSATYGDFDYWVIKLDSNGNKLWEKNYGGKLRDLLVEMQPTADGGYLLGGFSNSRMGIDKSEDSRGNFDTWIIKIDQDGRKVWDKTLGGYEADWLHSLKVANNGKDFILGIDSNSGQSGEKTQAGPGGGDIWIVYLKDLGNSPQVAWDRTLGSLEPDYDVVARQTADGGYVIGCSSEGGVGGDKTDNNRGQIGDPDYWFLKLDANRNIQWNKTYGGNDYDQFTTFEILPNGNYLLGGSSLSGISSEKTEPQKGLATVGDYWLVEINPTGVKTWDKSIGGVGDDWLSAMTYLPAQSACLLAGTANAGFSFINGIPLDAGADRSEDGFDSYDYWIVKIKH